MTITAAWEVKCPTCKRSATLRFRVRTQDYVLSSHYTSTHIKCAASGTTYPRELAQVVFGK